MFYSGCSNTYLNDALSYMDCESESCALQTQRRNQCWTLLKANPDILLLVNYNWRTPLPRKPQRIWKLMTHFPSLTAYSGKIAFYTIDTISFGATVNLNFNAVMEQLSTELSSNKLIVSRGRKKVMNPHRQTIRQFILYKFYSCLTVLLFFSVGIVFTVGQVPAVPLTESFQILTKHLFRRD